MLSVSKVLLFASLPLLAILSHTLYGVKCTCKDYNILASSVPSHLAVCMLLNQCVKAVIVKKFSNISMSLSSCGYVKSYIVFCSAVSTPLQALSSIIMRSLWSFVMVRQAKTI